MEERRHGSGHPVQIRPWGSPQHVPNLWTDCLDHSLWPTLQWAPKYRQLAVLQDQLDRTTDPLGIKLLTVASPSLLKKVVNLLVMMNDPEDLTRGVQYFVLGQHTNYHRKRAATSAERYSNVIGGGSAPSMAVTDVLLAWMVCCYLQLFYRPEVNLRGPGSSTPACSGITPPSWGIWQTLWQGCRNRSRFSYTTCRWTLQWGPTPPPS